MTGAVRLRALAADLEGLVAALPARRLRSDGERRAAEAAVAELRAARRRFLDRHAEAVYDRLTDGRTRRLRLPELVAAAQRHLPGVVPAAPALAAERSLPLSERDGWEVDLGGFFGAILGSPAAGEHLIATMRAPCPRAVELIEGFRATGVADLSTVTVARADGIAHLTIHNEGCLNAEDEQLADDMETAVDLVLTDPLSRVGVLRGGVMRHPRYRGRRVFSAGLNLTALRAGRISLVGFLLRRELTYVCKILHGALTDGGGTAEKPWLAAVDGFAIGGGMQLLLVFDRVVAADDAYFSLPAAQEGIVPGAANLRLTRAVGGRLARQLLLAGRRIAATEPAAALLCDEVVPADAMDGAVASAARLLDAPAVGANRRMLRVAEEPPDLLRRYLAEFAVLQAERLYSADVHSRLEERERARQRRSTMSQ
ncbi:(3,5-dihydroxyphenyl)acetyl-CoA 1,2-dioxygenase DpgC [Dactylosporangium sp. CA-233914]|uniref:(3,5-dihydroxyphenyl)acetyl-CoA 1,2-dioxygenase DpgC n=1 Tax=Dactylosporangium sp. CA-233914 TaxID=3239934 RepID=UPI003D902703